MVRQKVNGCVFGLKSIVQPTAGTPICKAWGIWTKNPSLSLALNGSHVLRPCGHPTVQVNGSNIAHSGVYPDDFALFINRSSVNDVQDISHLIEEHIQWPVNVRPGCVATPVAK